MNHKVFVEVTAKYDLEGNIIPISFVWEDGRVFEIDKITDIRQAASLKAGGQGIRYTCIVRGKETNLFREMNHQWFMERKE